MLLRAHYNHRTGTDVFTFYSFSGSLCAEEAHEVSTLSNNHVIHHTNDSIGSSCEYDNFSSFDICLPDHNRSSPSTMRKSYLQFL